VEGQGGGAASVDDGGEGGARVLSESLECCYCQQTGFAVQAVDRDEEAIKYEDTPAAKRPPVATPTGKRTPAMDRVMRGTRAIASPLRAGASFEQMRAKMINFEQAGWVRTTDGTLTPPLGLATPPTLFLDATGVAVYAGGDGDGLGQSLRPDNRGAFEAIAAANVAGAAAALQESEERVPVSPEPEGGPRDGSAPEEVPKARSRLSFANGEDLADESGGQ